MRVHSFGSHREFQSFIAAHERLAERNVRHMRHPSNDELSNKKCASTKLPPWLSYQRLSLRNLLVQA
jgi:hypothetical protein